MAPKLPQRLHLQSLQILRAFAALVVVYYHIKGPLNDGSQMGAFGVDIFFVLSGFVIAMVAEATTDVRVFFLNRIARIVPLYWILNFGVFAIACVAPQFLNSTTANMGNLLRSLFFIPYYKEDGSLRPVLAVGWTLNYEMLFYLLATVALLRSRQHFLPLTAVLVVLAYGLGWALPTGAPIADALRSPLLFEFVLGMAVYKVRGQALLARMPAWGAVLVIPVMLIAMVACERAGMHYRALGLGLPAAALLLSALRLEAWLARVHVRLTRMLVHLGDASYATYLSHFYVVQAMAKLIAPRLPMVGADTVPGTIITLLAAMVAGSVLYQLVDKTATAYARIGLRRVLLGRPAGASPA